MSEKKVYLGDGLYASDDGYQVYLRTERENEEHWVALDSQVLQAFFSFVAKSRGLNIEIERKEKDVDTL